MKLTVSVRLNLKTKEAIKAVKDATRLAMRDTVREVAKDAVDNAPPLDHPHPTGTNRRSIKYEVGPGGEFAQGDLTGAVFSSSGYGGILETGSFAHLISIKRAKVLTDGKIFFGKTVHHPGTAPRPYFKPALDKNFTPEKFADKVKKYLK